MVTLKLIRYLNGPNFLNMLKLLDKGAIIVNRYIAKNILKIYDGIIRVS